MTFYKNQIKLILIFVIFININYSFADLTEGKNQLEFKEYGPFYGIKKNGKKYRGVLLGTEKDGEKSDWYGLFTNSEFYWKGYFKHTLKDGNILYQYNEYELDENGNVIKDQDGIFKVVDSYLISADEFKKVKSYIKYDIPIPFSLYNFDIANNNEINKIDSKEEIKPKIKNIKLNQGYEETIKNLKINDPLIFELEKINEITNIRVEIKKTRKNSRIGINDQIINFEEIKTNFIYIDQNGNQREYNVITNNKYPKYKIYNFNYQSDVYRYEENIPKDFKPIDINSNINQKNILQVSLGTLTNDIVIANSPTPLTEIIYAEEMASIATKLYNKQITKEDALESALLYLENKFNYFNYYDDRIFSHLIENEKKEFLNFSLVNFENGNFGGICSENNKYNYFFKNNFKEKNCSEIYKNKLKNLNIYSIFEDLNNLQHRLEAKLNNNSNKKFKSDENYYALVIGNNNYEFLEKLDAAENDAKVIADVLEKKYGFEVKLLLNADQETTVDTLFNITDKLKKNDNLLIYYAGHGELDKAENRGYWLPVDASYEKRSKWISNQRIVDRIKATKAKHVLLVADSCFSGTLMRSGTNLQNQEQVDDKYIERLKNKKTRLVITSGGNEPVVDSVGGDHSLFALKFIDTLKNNNTVINSQILFENVRRYVVANADQTPERAMVHKTGHDGGDFLFFPK